MQVSFDGMRRNATNAMNALQGNIEDMLKKYEYDLYDSDRQDLIESFNEAAMFVDMFNCLFDDDVDGDMNNLSDLEINRLSEEE
ncbi:hypothetical protein [Sulfurovum mangrovi]|uniref:hypothetical protein n=1 Tax=Sulfurovum mangrovi TaxID=2893889 RepID=UPI001E5C00C6|nr:hypothetical protein [Sulfurovum mangrovi]UFH59810.1 hypothetical protein LN246_02950 [Sulfurovum mangrovi]UFH59861.1 hypothetical protein LN246_03210 [Sulfurovum mangrovi]UFH60607.1 hypothetical protein LN246_13595 [Sulfurovum mangrovi]